MGEKSSCLSVPRCLPGDYRVGATVVPLCWSPVPVPGRVGPGVCRRPETGRVHGAAAPGVVAGPPALPRLPKLRLKGGAARFRGLPGLPWRLHCEGSACRAGGLRLIPGSGRFPWRRECQPTPVFLPGESHRH